MANNYIHKISAILDSANLFYSFFNVPTRNPHRVCISDESMCGNCWGKIVIEGKTWHKVYDIIKTINFTTDLFIGRKLHEVPDNVNGNQFYTIDIKLAVETLRTANKPLLVNSIDLYQLIESCVGEEARSTQKNIAIALLKSLSM